MPEIWTVGHARHSAEQLLALLRVQNISWVADVRRHPFSRRHPQFSQPALEGWLKAAGLGYCHFPDLGGRRHPVPELVTNAALRDPGLRGYADWSGSPVFRAALAELCALACHQPTAIMCAEADPARCHRMLLADQLVARGFAVHHILVDGSILLHRLAAAARILPDGRVVYPPPQPPLFD